MKRLAHLVLLLASVGSAASVEPDILVSPGSSPCDRVHFKLWQKDKLTLDVYLAPDNKHKFVMGKALPQLVKGQTYRVVTDCVNLKSGGFSNSGGLTFAYDGRTLIVEFNDTGYNIRRGGVR